MFLSLSEIETRLKQLREQRANINQTIDYYEHMKQQAIDEHYRGKYTLSLEDSSQIPTARF